jgi:hypothetical protein
VQLDSSCFLAGSNTPTNEVKWQETVYESEVKGKSGDGGIDGIGVLRLNLLSLSPDFPFNFTFAN